MTEWLEHPTQKLSRQSEFEGSSNGALFLWARCLKGGRSRADVGSTNEEEEEEDGGDVDDDDEYDGGYNDDEDGNVGDGGSDCSARTYVVLRGPYLPKRVP